MACTCRHVVPPSSSILYGHWRHLILGHHVASHCWQTGHMVRICRLDSQPWRSCASSAYCGPLESRILMRATECAWRSSWPFAHDTRWFVESESHETCLHKAVWSRRDVAPCTWLHSGSINRQCHPIHASRCFVLSCAGWMPSAARSSLILCGTVIVLTMLKVVQAGFACECARLDEPCKWHCCLVT